MKVADILWTFEACKTCANAVEGSYCSLFAPSINNDDVECDSYEEDEEADETAWSDSF